MQSMEVRGRFAQEAMRVKDKKETYSPYFETSRKFKRIGHQYHNPLYSDLLMSVVPLRKAYRQEKDLEARKQMAKEEFDHWHGYLKSRKEEISTLDAAKEEIDTTIDDEPALRETHHAFRHSLQEPDRRLLREWFDKYKGRHSNVLEAKQLTEFHGEFAKMFRFRVPLHPKNLSQLIHPFHGYLTAFPGLQLDFAGLLDVYEYQIAASYEKTFGRELLGDELSCLSFWLLKDVENKGWLTLDELKTLLYAFRFDHLFLDDIGKPDDVLTLEKFKAEFKFHLKFKPGEILMPPPATTDPSDIDRHVIIRFDLVRDLFLERGL